MGQTIFMLSCIFVSCVMAECDSRMPGSLLLDTNAAENWRLRNFLCSLRSTLLRKVNMI